MKYAIRYYSKSGNTKRLADALSDYLNVPALDISHDLTEDVDVLFFGSGVYGSSLDPGVISFISNIGVHCCGLLLFCLLRESLLLRRLG